MVILQSQFCRAEFTDVHMLDAPRFAATART
ncbi:hypothetical protein BC739_007203 [Kutzneria viridogrisea]|uniref:Uncharacterized protein n=1 Tax=Kutzneria viridogrisea TaxID=47990 RepID=A0ABR6BTI0_9PSEU|nr:hypothetical protein [Kutzneria viridogrisea]